MHPEKLQLSTHRNMHAGRATAIIQYITPYTINEDTKVLLNELILYTAQDLGGCQGIWGTVTNKQWIPWDSHL